MQTTVNSSPLPQTYDSSALTFLHTHAQRCAAQQSVAPDDCADCAQAFVVHALRHEELLISLFSQAYASRSAANFARNYRRSRVRLSRHETTWPQQRDEDGQTADQEFACPRRSAHAAVVRREARHVLSAALLRLTATQRELVTRHYVEQQSFVELAEEMGSTPDAVRMTITRACKRLRDLLREEGMTEEDAGEYLSEMGKRRGGVISGKKGQMKYFAKNFAVPVRFGRRAVL